MTTTARASVPGLKLGAEEQRRFAVDGVLPASVMRPESPQGVGESLRACVDAGVSTVIHGGATQMGLGMPPRRYDVALSTRGLSRLLEHEPADLTCRVEAGMLVADLQAALLRHGQRLPLEPPHPDRATLGGTVAANASGLRRARFGGVRDWVIGIAVAYPSGIVARAGGKVVKNVAGYDLMKLHTGALGTLGVIVELNFKVQTMPESQITVYGRFAEQGAAIAAGRRLARQYLAPAAMVVLDRDVLRDCGIPAGWPWTLALQFEGYQREMGPALDQAVAAIEQHAGEVETAESPPEFWANVRDWAATADGQVSIFATTSLTGLDAVLESVGSDGRVMAEPAAGGLRVLVDPAIAPSLLQRMRAAANEGGQVIVRGAPAGLKQTLDVWGPPPPGFLLMRELKRALDPAGTLNPGRFVGGI